MKVLLQDGIAKKKKEIVSKPGLFDLAQAADIINIRS